MDLLLQLLILWIAKNNPPDILSREWDSNDNSYIHFEWLSGKVFNAPYTSKRYKALWTEFNNYWKKQQPMKEFPGGFTLF